MSYSQSQRDIPIDVYCHFTKDGGIIPLKIKMPDDEGELQVYKVKAYKEVPFITDSKTGIGMRTGMGNAAFECKIEIYGRIKIIKIFYIALDRAWKYRQMLVR